MTVRRCRATTRDGRPCSAQARPDSELCVWHDPRYASRRAEWSATGGRQSSAKARLRKSLPDEALTPDEVQGLLAKALRDVLAGALEPGRANAAANLARALMAVREAATLEARLQALEDIVSGRSRRSA